MHDNTADDLLKEAVELRKARQYEKAWGLQQSLKEPLKGSAFFWSSFAQLALEMRRYDDAAAYARTALEIRPQNHFARSVHAQALERLGREQDALEEYRARLEREYHPLDFKRFVALAVKLKALDVAEAVFAQYGDRKKDDAGFFQIMAEGHRKAGRPDKAEALLGKALAIDPAHPQARRRSLSIKLEGKPPEEAVSELTTLLRLKEYRDDIPVMEILSSKLKELHRFEEAASWLKKVLALKPDSMFHRTQLAYVYSKMGDPEGVIAMLTPVLEADPDDVYAMRTFMAALRKRCDKEEAARILDGLIARHPEFKKLHGYRKDIEKWPSKT